MKIDKSQIEGLPPSAAVQQIREKIYVYFAYCYTLDGKRHQERDYIGTVQNNRFVPNDYFIDHKPTFKNRPLRNWTNPKKAEIEKLKYAEASGKISGSSRQQDFADGETYERSAGASAVAAKILLETGMAADVTAVLNGNLKDTVGALNLGMHAALTGRATYLAGDEAFLQKFIGRNCPTSQRASELHAKLGRMDGLDLKISNRRCLRLQKGELLALDGTRLDCDSDGIELSAVGKRKDGTFGRQVNYSVLFNASRGESLAYRVYAGNFNDISTLDDFRSIWKRHGIADKDPRILLDRGYFSREQIVKLHKDGFRFLVGAKTNINCVREIIEERNSEFYDMDSLVRDRRFYGLSQDCPVTTAAGSAELRFHVFRSPDREMDETSHLLNQLDEFERIWLRKRKLTEKEQSLLAFYVDPTPGIPLVRDKEAVRQHCYTLGFFAMAGNEKRSCAEALNDYDYRNEVEIFFRQHMGQQHSTRVHTMETLNGAMFTTFIGTSIVTNLLHRMRSKDEDGRQLRTSFTVASLIKALQKVHLIRDLDGTVRLTNVTAKERNIVARLGFPGLFDSAEGVENLLSTQTISDLVVEKTAVI